MNAKWHLQKHMRQMWIFLVWCWMSDFKIQVTFLLDITHCKPSMVPYAKYFSNVNTYPRFKPWTYRIHWPINNRSWQTSAASLSLCCVVGSAEANRSWHLSKMLELAQQASPRICLPTCCYLSYVIQLGSGNWAVSFLLISVFSTDAISHAESKKNRCI